jgi:membrane fusion protein (multidrug efflux system)
MTDAQSNVQETVPTTSASDDNMQNKRKKFLGFLR